MQLAEHSDPSFAIPNEVFRCTPKSSDLFSAIPQRNQARAAFYFKLYRMRTAGLATGVLLAPVPIVFFAPPPD